MSGVPPPPGTNPQQTEWTHCPICGSRLFEGTRWCPKHGPLSISPPPPRGAGPRAEPPVQARRWNWGGFLLSWIWGLRHRVWVSLLAFPLIPLGNLIMPFVLGAKGGEWAWEKWRRDVEAFRHTQRRWAVGGLITWIVAIGGVIALVALTPGVTEEKLTNRLASEDGSIRLTVPSGWVRDDDLAPGTVIGARHLGEELYAIVLVASRRDVLPGTDLDEFARVTRQPIVSTTAGMITSGPVHLQVGSAPAVRCEFVGSPNGIDVAMLQTVVQTPDRFVEVVAWTVESRMEDFRPLLTKLSDTLRVQGADIGEPV